MRKSEGMREAAERITRARTARALAMGRKRKVGEEEDEEFPELCPSQVQLIKTRTHVMPENSESRSSTSESVSPGRALASCRSINELNRAAKESFEFKNQESETLWICDLVHCIESRTMAELSTATTGSQDWSMPSGAELEELFAAAEKEIQKQFSNKYLLATLLTYES